MKKLFKFYFKPITLSILFLIPLVNDSLAVTQIVLEDSIIPELQLENDSNEDYAIFVAFSKVKATIGAKDSSAIAILARKYGLDKKQWPVGHTGLILVDKNTGITEYADFGRFSGHSYGTGITRYKQENLITLSAKFNTQGQLLNSQDIVESLFYYGNYFASHKRYGKEVIFTSVSHVNFEKMQEFVIQSGEIVYGFGEGKTYCTKFATDVLEAGGYTLRQWDILELSDSAQRLINSKGLLRSLFKVIKLVKSGPTGENVAYELNLNNSIAYGRFKYKKFKRNRIIPFKNTPANNERLLAKGNFISLKLKAPKYASN